MPEQSEPGQEQGESTPPPESEPAAAQPETTAPRPSATEMAAWSGHKLDEMGGASVGRIDGLYVDDPSGSAEWLLVRLGRFGHHTLVPARDAVAGAEHVWVPFTREAIRRAPRIKPGTPLAKELETEFLEHYGLGGTAGRATEIADRPANAATARPAS